MKIYTCNGKRTESFKRVDWLRVLIVFIITFILFFSFFHFLIGGSGMLDKAISTSLLMSYLIAIGYMVSDSIENRVNVYIEKDNMFYVLCPHSFGIEYDSGIISIKDFKKIIKDKNNIEDIFNNLEKYQGIDLIEIKEIKKVKMFSKFFKVRAKVISNEWYGKGGIFTTDTYLLKKKERTKTFCIPKDYPNHLELYNDLKGTKSL